MPFPAALRALNHRDFRLFWTGQAVSSVGSWMQSVGLSWLVLELTGSPFRLGLVSALQFGPVLLFSAVAGVVVDRTPKRRLVLGTQMALMLPALVLAGLAWTGWVRYWHVAALAGTIGVVNALDMPSRQSFLVEMVGREDLLNAIALNSASFNTARVVGPALGGLLIARYGTAVAFLLNALSFLAVLLTLLAVRAGSDPRPRRGTTIRQELADGLRYATRTPLVALILGLVFAVSTFAMNHGVLVPLFARDVLHEGVRVFGLLMASLGAGAVVGAVVVATLGYAKPPLAAVVAPGLGVALGILSLAFVRHLALAAIVLFVVGALQIAFQNACNTIVQVTVPDELRGRVMGVY
ncbi:MAG: MFS transporter, partial [Candidatus Rokuibacteriota bacterium]